MGNLSELRELVFASDNKDCFIERERMSEVSTPILDCDFFAGRVVEALPDADMERPSGLLASGGHMSFDYEKLLKVGLKGILQEMKETAERKKDKESADFVKKCRNSDRCH